MLAAVLLQDIVNRDHALGHFSLPIPTTGTNDFPIIQYADDTILVLPACATHLGRLKIVLNRFAESTGLKVNFHKSELIPINLTDQQTNVLAAELGYMVGSMPFTYLGLPLGTMRPSMTDFMPLVDRIERRMSNTSALLSYGGRVTILNSVISSLATYIVCSLEIPTKIIEHVDN